MSSLCSTLSGIYAALVTPFDSIRRIDESGLEYLVEYLNGCEGLAGFALCTEAAEDALLSADERKMLVRLVSQLKSSQFGILVRLSSPSSKHAAELAKVAESVGAQAVSLTLPRLAGLGYRELYRHVDHVCRAVKIPVLLDTHRGDGLESLQIEEFETLINYDGLRGVIAPQATGQEVTRWNKWFEGRDAAILGGCSLARMEQEAAGATGFVCGMYVLASEAADVLAQAMARGKTNEAKKIEAKWSAACLLLGPKLRESTPAGLQKIAAKIAKRSLEEKVLPWSYSAPALKAALKLQGHIIREEVRSPLETMRKNAIQSFEGQLRKVGILT